MFCLRLPLELRCLHARKADHLALLQSCLPKLIDIDVGPLNRDELEHLAKHSPLLESIRLAYSFQIKSQDAEELLEKFEHLVDLVGKNFLFLFLKSCF